ncbi:MAG: aminotransferase class III-fold pyridoxal phosphate-dependent enzyme [Hyphomicrobiales bacterium]
MMTDGIDQALAVAIANYAAKRPKTAALQTRAEKVMPGGNTRTVLFAQPFPIRVAKAEGSVITDVDGHSYTDFLGEYSAGLYGHSHPRIARAVAEAMAAGINYGAHHEREIAFAEAVTERFALERVRFTNSGTEANMLAVAAARHFTGRSASMPMRGGYHGGTLYYGGGGSPVNAPFETVLGTYNDIDATRAALRATADRLAAVIVEPMLGSGGCIPASAEFLQMLRAECSTHNIVLIFDEVMTSRLGPGGLSAILDIQPDLKALGKYIGGGMSFGAFGGRADIMDQFDPRKPGALPHAGTFNNNTLTMTAGRAGITEIYTRDAALQHTARGEALKARLNAIAMSHQAALQVTGSGTLLNFHPVAGTISTPEDVAKADVRLRRLLYFALLEQGVYVAERGFMALALTLDDDAFARLEAALDHVLRQHGHLFRTRLSG